MTSAEGEAAASDEGGGDESSGEEGVRFELVLQPTEGSAAGDGSDADVVYRGTFSFGASEHAVVAHAQPSGNTVRIEAKTLAERDAPVLKAGEALLKAALRSAARDGRRPPRRVTRWRPVAR